MKRGRFAAGALLALLLAPATCFRSELPPENLSAPLIVEPLDVQPVTFGGFRLEEAWRLRSDSRVFGGYSALASLTERTLVAGSDAGSLLFIDRDGPQPVSGRLTRLLGQNATTKRDVDLEALSLDPSGARIWAAFERSNSIQAFDMNFRPVARFNPPAMAGWSHNSGVESLVALADGRFLAIAEGARDGLHSVVLFDGRPDDKTPASVFWLEPLEGFRPVDAVQVGENEILVLLRDMELSLPPRFRSAIASYSLDDITAGETWKPGLIARFPESVPEENYEGLAVIDRGPQGVRLWVISDDNFSVLQDTLMLEITYLPPDPSAHEKTREMPARP